MKQLKIHVKPLLTRMIQRKLYTETIGTTGKHGDAANMNTIHTTSQEKTPMSHLFLKKVITSLDPVDTKTMLISLAGLPEDKKL